MGRLENAIAARAESEQLVQTLIEERNNLHAELRSIKEALKREKETGAAVWQELEIQRTRSRRDQAVV